MSNEETQPNYIWVVVLKVKNCFDTCTCTCTYNVHAWKCEKQTSKRKIKKLPYTHLYNIIINVYVHVICVVF